MRKIALLGLLASFFPDVPVVESNKFQMREHSRSRDSTRSNRKYVHKKALCVEWQPADWHPHVSGNKFGLVRNAYFAYNLPKRRGERKGVPGVPRGFGSIKDISF